MNKELLKAVKTANSKIKLIDITNEETGEIKKYAPVNERNIAFRKVYPDGVINTKYEIDNDWIIFEAQILNTEGKLLATGHAYEKLTNSNAIERCETSAVGRALVFAGFNRSSSIASADDMQKFNKVKEEPNIVLSKPIERSSNDQESLTLNQTSVINKMVDTQFVEDYLEAIGKQTIDELSISEADALINKYENLGLEYKK